MLITLCYSVLTWIQSRHRQEIYSWVEDCCVKEKASLVFLRDDGCPQDGQKGNRNRTRSCSREREFPYNSSSNLSNPVSRSESVSSNFSNPQSRQESTSEFNVGNSVNSMTSSKNSFHGSTGSLKQTSDLCYNATNIRWRRLLWEEDKTKVLALSPLQIIELHDWTAFIGTKIIDLNENSEEPKKFYILLEAEPGVIRRQQYRKFCQFGKITAWKCGGELALVLLSDLSQLIDLMHIFRLGQIILDGGWRVYRLTTVACEGAFGTLISRTEALNGNNSTLTPGDLQRLSAGIFENRDRDREVPSHSGTPKLSLSKETSKHDIVTINEEKENSPEETEDTLKKLPNWYDRSPKKRSVVSISSSDKPNIGRRRIGSFSAVSSNGGKSSSLASLLLCSKSLSVDEEDLNRPPAAILLASNNPLSPLSSQTSLARSSATLPARVGQSQNPRQSFENLLGSHPVQNNILSRKLSTSQIQSPVGEIGPGFCPGGPGVGGKPFKSYSAFSSPKKFGSSSHGQGSSMQSKRTPNRLGKPPNILVLCDNAKKRSDIAGILKSMLANDRYVIYDIRWDQLAVGGWADQTALLVLAGTIPDKSHIPILLQFLGDGGRLFAWCCDSTPFGPDPGPVSSVSTVEAESRSGSSGPKVNGKGKKVVLHYSSVQTHPISVSSSIWGVAKDAKDLPPGFQRLLETNDSDGISRPLTASVFAKVKGTNEAAIMQLDGGALGGKAIFSRVQFEDNKDEESSLALLSLILGQVLGIDCTKIKSPEYTYGYLLGDHLKVRDFLGSVPSVIQQSDLTVELIPRGSQGSKPSCERFPVRILECPSNFSTLDYYNNLTTKELGRLVIYTDVITSAMHVFNGHPLQPGIVVIARRQTAGKGRGKNIWLSPEGCACFATQLNVQMNSQIGRRLPLVQHIAAMAVVLAVPNHQELNLKLKWPNDIYLDGQKIGGVLVETRIQGNTAALTIGIGVNVSNDHPTLCLNTVLRDNLKLSCPSLIAKCLSQMEVLLERVEHGELNQVLATYTENWIHNQEEDDIVRVEVSGGNYAECKVSGVDEFGFLRVVDINSGHVFSVQPDGNSFDIANKLIAIKT